MTAVDVNDDDRAALARELQWLAGILPLGIRLDSDGQRKCLTSRGGAG